jgi:hypothetical protein
MVESEASLQVSGKQNNSESDSASLGGERLTNIPVLALELGVNSNNEMLLAVSH